MDQYTEEKIADPEVLAMVSRVNVVHDPELDAKGASHAYYVHVTIDTRAGGQHSAEVYWSKGHPTNPFTEADLASKCHRLADGVIGPGRVDRLIALVQKLDGLEQLDELFKTLE